MREAEDLARSIVAMKQKIKLCNLCYALSDAEQCQICADVSRDRALLCVVEQPADMVSIEKSGAFNGLYHILGGVLSPMEGIGPEELRLKSLFERIERGGVREVIIATGTNVEGESTAALHCPEACRLRRQGDPDRLRRPCRGRLEVCGPDDHAMRPGGSP